MDTNIRNIAHHGKIMSICYKQHSSNILALIHEKLSNTEAELKKALLIKKCVFAKSVFPVFLVNPVGTYLLKVNNRNTRKRCKICSKLTIKTLFLNLAMK